MSEMRIIIDYFAIFYVNEIKILHIPLFYTNNIFFISMIFFNKSIQICTNGFLLILYAYTFKSKLYFHKHIFFSFSTLFRNVSILTNNFRKCKIILIYSMFHFRHIIICADDCDIICLP